MKLKNKIKQEIREIGWLYRFLRKILKALGFGPEDYYTIIDKWKAVYFYLPKNGNTSVKKAIYKQLYGKDTKNIHYYFPRTRFRNPVKDKYKDYFKFAFVRNPYDRLVSGYKDKIQSPGQTGIINSQKEFYRDMPFKEFVKIVSKTPDSKIDRHFRSQSWFLTHKHGKNKNKNKSKNKKQKLIPDFIGKLENLNEDYKKAMKKLGIKNPVELPHANKGKINKNKQKKYKDYYKDKEIKKLVQKRYKKDFELFDYDEGV